MESKYYIPKKEEFHIGFEYEIKFSKDDKWSTKVLEDTFDLDCVLISSKYKDIRVKYLDASDIESFGFVHIGTTIDKWYKLNKECTRKLSNFRNRSIQLKHDFRDNQGVVIEGFEYEDLKGDSDILYRGSCRNKSELKTILQMIGVLEDD